MPKGGAYVRDKMKEVFKKTKDPKVIETVADSVTVNAIKEVENMKISPEQRKKLEQQSNDVSEDFENKNENLNEDQKQDVTNIQNDLGLTPPVTTKLKQSQKPQPTPQNEPISFSSSDPWIR